MRESSPIKNLKVTFESLDNDNVGYIPKESLKKAILYTGDNFDKGIINQEIEKSPDQITFDQFASIFERSEIAQNQIQDNSYIFHLYDRERKGYIDENDIRRVAEITGVSLTAEEIEGMLNSEIVKGRVTFDEFAEIMDNSNDF